MNSDAKAAIFSLLGLLFICANIYLFIWFFASIPRGYESYVQFPKTQQETLCKVHETDVMKLRSTAFQAIWIVAYNYSKSERFSKIIQSSYSTFTDAKEATLSQYKVGEVYSCYFNKNKSYDLRWRIDDEMKKGREDLITAFICGISILIIWTIAFGYLYFICCFPTTTTTSHKV